MVFTPASTLPDFEQLKTVFLQAGLQTSDQPTFQTIINFLNATSKMQKVLSGRIGDIQSTVSGLSTGVQAPVNPSVFPVEEDQLEPFNLAMGLVFQDQFVKVRTETSTYTATLSDYVILCDATSAAFTVTLPLAANGKIEYNIKKIDSTANAVTVDGNGTETIDGALTQVIGVQYNSMMIVSDLSNWYII